MYSYGRTSRLFVPAWVILVVHTSRKSPQSLNDGAVIIGGGLHDPEAEGGRKSRREN